MTSCYAAALSSAATSSTVVFIRHYSTSTGTGAPTLVFYALQDFLTTPDVLPYVIFCIMFD